MIVPIDIKPQTKMMNSIQFITNPSQCTTTTNKNSNNKMDIHLLLNAADEVKRNHHQLPHPTVVLPRTIAQQPQSSQYYLGQSNSSRLDKSEAELEAIEFLSKLNNIKSSINNAFQGLKYQAGSTTSTTHKYKNIKELNKLSNELISVCQETRQSISKQAHKRHNHVNYRSPLSPHVTNLNSMTLPYTINKHRNPNHSHNHNYNYNYHINKGQDHHHLLKKKFERIHSVNVVTPQNIKLNPQTTMMTPPTNTPTGFMTSNNQSPKVIPKENSTTSTTPIIRKNHEMDGKPCTHCLSIEKTPEWRSGPYGNEQKICNACGLFYRKLKQKFGLNDANMIMRYRKSKCATNRRVPQMFDVPPEWSVQNWESLKGESGCGPNTPQGVELNKQLISPVVTPVIKTSLCKNTPTTSNITLL